MSLRSLAVLSKDKSRVDKVVNVVASRAAPHLGESVFLCRSLVFRNDSWAKHPEIYSYMSDNSKQNGCISVWLIYLLILPEL